MFYSVFGLVKPRIQKRAISLFHGLLISCANNQFFSPISFYCRSGGASLTCNGGKFTLSQSIILYRKYKPDAIFDGSQILPEGMVLVMDANNVVEAIVSEDLAGDDLRILKGILSPGFVNAHCHLELSHLKGLIPQHTGLVDFVQQIISTRDSIVSPQTGKVMGVEELAEFKQFAMANALQEMQDGGTVAVGDICNTADSVAIKAGSSLYWHNFVEVSGFVDAAATARLSAAEHILSSFLSNTAASANSLSPHAPYSVSASLFELLNDKTANQRISIHNQESAAEDELYRQKTGAFLNLYRNLGIPVEGFLHTQKSSFQSWNPYFNRGQTIISVHNTFMGQDDILQASSNMNFCICINANLYIENSLPPLDLLLKNGCQMLLGTDSYASNNSLQIADEIKTIQKYFPHIPLQTILRWATLNGAKALGIDDRFGSFEKGKAPGIVLLGEGGTSSIVI